MVIIRNSRWAIAAIGLSSFVAFLSVPCFAILALGTLHPWRSMGVDRVIEFFAYAATAQGSGSMGLWMWRRSKELSRSYVQWNGDTLRIHLGKRVDQTENLLQANDIQGVTYQRIDKIQICSIVGANDRVLSLTSTDFLRPHAVARKIAAVVGIAVTKIPPKPRALR